MKNSFREFIRSGALILCAKIEAVISALTLWMMLRLNILLSGYALKVGRSNYFLDAFRAIGYNGHQPFVYWIIISLLEFIFVAYTYFVYIYNKPVEDPLKRGFFSPKRHTEYGSAHFEEKDDYDNVLEENDVTDADGMILGKKYKTDIVLNIRESNTRINHHVMIWGASGSGKTYSVIIPDMLQCAKRGESIIVTDPDGGLERDTRTILTKLGYTIRTLNLVNLEQSDGWNCLKALDKDKIDETSIPFVKTVISNCMDFRTQSVYKDCAAALLRALILRVYLGDDYQNKTLWQAYNLLVEDPKPKEHLEKLFDPATIPAGAEPALAPYRSFKTASENLGGNVLTNLATALQILQSGMLGKVLGTDDIDLKLPGDRKCCYYCRFPALNNPYQFVVSLFFSSIMTTLTHHGMANGGPLKIPVNFILDEFPSIGVLPEWDKVLATVRKHRINVHMISQNIEQLINNYDTAATTLVGNCAIQVSVGVNDEQTIKYLVGRAGNTTVTIKNTRHGAGDVIFDSGWNNYTSGMGKRELLDATDFWTMDPDDAIIILQGHNPIYVNKFPWIEHPFHDLAGPDPIGVERGDITDDQLRMERRAAEEEYIENCIPAEDLIRAVNREHRLARRVAEESRQPKKKPGIFDNLKPGRRSVKPRNEALLSYTAPAPAEADTDSTSDDEDFYDYVPDEETVVFEAFSDEDDGKYENEEDLSEEPGNEEGSNEETVNEESSEPVMGFEFDEDEFYS